MLHVFLEQDASINMTNTIILILIGAFIGWNLPQPGWAKWIQAKALRMFGKLKSKFQKK